MTPLVVLHAGAATLALPLGAAALWLPRNNRLHRAMGRLWVGLMLFAAVTSFLITNGDFSWIHLLSLWTLFWLVVGIARIRRGDVVGHQRAMTGLMIGLVAAGVGALAPNRSSGALLFG